MTLVKSILLDIFFLSLIAWGSVRLHVLLSERQQLHREVAELSEVVGRLEVEHPNRLYWVRLESSEPATWRFRLYLPAGVTSTWKTLALQFDEAWNPQEGSSSMSSSGSSLAPTEPRELIVDAGLIQNADGTHTFALSRCGSSSSLSAQQLPGLDTRAPDSFRVDTPAVGVQQEVSSDGTIRLLQVRAGIADKSASENASLVFPGFRVELEVSGIPPRDAPTP